MTTKPDTAIAGDSPSPDEAQRLRQRLSRLSAAIAEAEAELAQMERLDRRLLTQRTSMAGILDGLLSVITGRLPHARAAVAVAEPFTSRLEVASHRGLPAEALGAALDAGQGPIGQTLRSGSPRAYPGRRFGLDEELLGAETTITVVPLLQPRERAGRGGEAATGVILVATADDQRLRGADLEFLRRAGVHGAVLIENARLLDTLRASEETYRTMVERAHLGMALLDRDGGIRHMNEPMRDLLGGALPLGASFASCVQATSHGAMRRHFEQAPEEELAPLDVRLLAGSVEVPARLSITPIRDHASTVTGYVVMARDLTREAALEDERQAMARLVQQAEKLSAVGKFVAGIAHELNNPLTVVIGYAELLTEAEGLPKRLGASLQQILLHARRCGRIVDDLLKFAHHERTRPERLYLASVVEQAMAATRLRERSGVDVEMSVDPTLPALVGSPHALCQLVTNVLDNACDAVALVPRRGRIRVDVTGDAEQQTIEVQDNGPGIAEVERIFDPFYTTKPIGKGTGLGLSICYGIARDHGGDLYAENIPGGGARLRIVLPQAQGLEDDLDLPALPGLESDTTLAQVELDSRPRLLVVDDESAILELAQEALAPYCDVTTAESVEAAVNVLETASFDIILTDLRLPDGLTGADFFEILCDRWPVLSERVAFMTGDTIGQASQAFLDRVRRPCLSKPFKIAQLVAFIKALV